MWHDPPSGGAQRAFSEVLSRLARRHRVDVFRLGSGPGGPTSESAYGLPVRPVPFSTRHHRRRGLYWNDWLTLRDYLDEERLERQLAAEIGGGGYDIVLVSVLRWGYAPALLRYAALPAVYFCHEPPRRFYEPWCRPQAAPLTAFERGRLIWRWPAQRLLDRWVRDRDRRHVRSAAAVLTNSHYTAERIRSVYSVPAEVCYLGVDAARFQPANRPADPRQVLSVGTLEAHKGFDFVIESLAAVPASIRPHLVIVGSGGHPRMPDRLQSLAGAAGVALTVRCSVPDQELAQLYQSSSLFLFGARSEPFGLVVLEAMASGLPVVAVGEGGLPEIVREGATGYLTEREPAAFAQRVEMLLRDAPLRRQMGSAARADAVNRWTWEATARQFAAALERAAGAPCGARAAS